MGKRKKKKKIKVMDRISDFRQESTQFKALYLFFNTTDQASK